VGSKQLCHSLGRNPADLLQYLDVSVTNADKCRELYAKRGGVITPGEQICAGGDKGKVKFIMIIFHEFDATLF
jgi:hypothetical protein